MEAQLTSSSTYHAEEYGDSWISSVPSDARFINTSYKRFPAETSITGNQIKFVLSRFDAGNVYLVKFDYLVSFVLSGMLKFYIDHVRESYSITRL